MYRHSRVATPALRNVSAVRTYQRRREPAPVQKNENLAARLQILLNGIEQRLTDSILRGMSIEIDKPHQRWHGSAGT
jgi:hypothetical protein